MRMGLVVVGVAVAGLCLGACSSGGSTEASSDRSPASTEATDERSPFPLTKIESEHQLDGAESGTLDQLMVGVGDRWAYWSHDDVVDVIDLESNEVVRSIPDIATGGLVQSADHSVLVGLPNDDDGQVTVIRSDTSEVADRFRTEAGPPTAPGLMSPDSTKVSWVASLNDDGDQAIVTASLPSQNAESTAFAYEACSGDGLAFVADQWFSSGDDYFEGNGSREYCVKGGGVTAIPGAEIGSVSAQIDVPLQAPKGNISWARTGEMEVVDNELFILSHPEGGYPCGSVCSKGEDRSYPSKITAIDSQNQSVSYSVASESVFTDLIAAPSTQRLYAIEGDEGIAVISATEQKVEARTELSKYSSVYALAVNADETVLYALAADDDDEYFLVRLGGGDTSSAQNPAS